MPRRARGSRRATQAEIDALTSRGVAPFVAADAALDDLAAFVARYYAPATLDALGDRRALADALGHQLCVAYATQPAVRQAFDTPAGQGRDDRFVPADAHPADRGPVAAAYRLLQRWIADRLAQADPGLAAQIPAWYAAGVRIPRAG